MLCGYIRYCHEYCWINSSCIIKKAADDLLDLLLVSIIEKGTVIIWSRCLIVLSIGDRIGHEQTMMWFQRGNMVVSCELFYDLFGHREIDITFVIIPFKIGTTVEVACTIIKDLVCFFGGYQKGVEGVCCQCT